MVKKILFRNQEEINYNLTGNGDYTLVFVRDLSNDEHVWSNQISYFDEDYLILSLNLEGKDKEAETQQIDSLDRFAQDINFVVSELNLQNVILIGKSDSGIVNLIAASTQPENYIGYIAVNSFINIYNSTNQEEKNQNADLESNQIAGRQKELVETFPFKLHLIEDEHFSEFAADLETLSLEGTDIQYLNKFPTVEGSKEINKLLTYAIDSVLTEVKNNSY